MTTKPHDDPDDLLGPPLQERLTALASDLQRSLEEVRGLAATTRPPHDDAGGDALAALAAFCRALEAHRDQAAILGHLLDAAAAMAPRAMLLISRGGNLKGWQARGFAPDFDPKSLEVDLGADSALSRAALACTVVRERTADREASADLARSLGPAPPEEMIAAPLWVRDRVAAVLYADRADSSHWQPDAIGIMASLTALSLETLPARVRHPRPAPSPREDAPRPSGTAATHEAVAASGSAPASVPLREATVQLDGAAGTGAEDGAAAEEQRLHEDARRFAKLLVSEILLYNQAEIEEGRRQKDLYERFREDIDRSRMIYEQRVNSRLSDAADYFHDELVRTLAGGDESAIHVPWR